MQKMLSNNILPIFGGVAGLILAILFFTFGFFKTIATIILIALGIYLGAYLKRSGMLEKFFPDK